MRRANVASRITEQSLIGDRRRYGQPQRHRPRVFLRLLVFLGPLLDIGSSFPLHSFGSYVILLRIAAEYSFSVFKSQRVNSFKMDNELTFELEDKLGFASFDFWADLRFPGGTMPACLMHLVGAPYLKHFSRITGRLLARFIHFLY